MEKIVLSIEKEYTKTPGARYIKNGNFSGEDFRETKLIPAFEKAQAENKKLLVDLDGCYGFLISFIDEAFGGLTYKFGKTVVNKLLEVKCNDESSLINDVNTAINEWEIKRVHGGVPDEKN